MRGAHHSRSFRAHALRALLVFVSLRDWTIRARAACEVCGILHTATTPIGDLVLCEPCETRLIAEQRKAS
jgi:hypothetical protein